MQMTDRNDLESIFQQALEFEDTSQREAYLDEVCGDDVELRSEMDRVLQSHDVAGSFLTGSSPNLGATELVARGARNESVLRIFKDVIGDVPSIALRESDEPNEQIQRPSSPEVPSTPADGRYQLHGEIARGGMGAVIKGRDTDLGRDLAIKVLLESHKNRPEVTQRFIEEAQIGGQLQHPGIAPVYELGQFADQRPYFTMKLVKGKTLAALLSSRQCTNGELSRFIGIFEQVCQTMAYAHSRGVIHRDLKPENIMVGAFGEVQVMDWGLAKVLKTSGIPDDAKPTERPPTQSVIETLRSSQSDTPLVPGGQTQMGSVMGTPAYMPPEQALGEIDQVDERCDVFGLGAILCEILTGQPPYVAEDHVRLFRMATRGRLEPCYERLQQSGADDELVILAKRCLAPEPKDRIPDAVAVSEQVTAHIENVATRLRESDMERAAQTARVVEERKRRKLTLVSATAIAVLIAGLGVGGFWLQQQQTQAAEAVAATEKKRADEEREAKEQVRGILYSSQIGVAQAAIDRGDLNRAERVLNSLRPVGNQPDLRGFEWYMLERRCMHPLETRDLGWEQSHEEYMGQRISRTFWHALSGDRRTYANLVTDDQGMTRLRVRSLESGESINEIELGKAGIYRERSSDHFVALNDDATLAAVFCGAEADDEKPYDNLRVIDIQTGEVMVEHLFENGDTVGRAFLRFDRLSQCVGIVQTRSRSEGPPVVFVAVLDLSERKLRWEKEVADSFTIVGFPRLDPAGTLLAVRVVESQDLDCSIRVFDSATGNENLRISLPAKSWPGEATFSPDGRSLVGLVQDGSLNEPGNPTSISNRFWVWDVETGQARLSSPIANGSSNLLFSHDGTMALVGDYRSRRPELIHLETGIVISRFDKDESQVSRFSPDDRFIETISHDGKLSRFEIPRNPFRNGKLEHYDGLGPSCISGDGTWFARLARPQRHTKVNSGRDNGALRLLVYDSVGALKHAISVSDAKINRSNSKTVRKFVVLDEHGTHATMFVGSKESRRIVTLDLNHPDQAATPLFVLRDDVSLHTLISSPTGSSVAAILNDDGSRVTKPFVQPTFRIWTSSSPKRRIVQAWDAGTQREIKLPKFVHPHAAGFSADGQLLAVASLTSDGASTIVSLVRLRSGEILETFDIGQNYVSQMEFAPSDELLACVTPSSESIHLYHRVSRSLSKFATQTVNDKTTITFSEDSSRLAAITPSHSGRTMRIWNTSTQNAVFEEHYSGSSKRDVMQINRVSGQDRLAGWSKEGPAIFWDGRPTEANAD